MRDSENACRKEEIALIVPIQVHEKIMPSSGKLDEIKGSFLATQCLHEVISRTHQPDLYCQITLICHIFEQQQKQQRRLIKIDCPRALLTCDSREKTFKNFFSSDTDEMTCHLKLDQIRQED